MISPDKNDVFAMGEKIPHAYVWAYADVMREGPGGEQRKRHLAW